VDSPADARPPTANRVAPTRWRSWPFGTEISASSIIGARCLRFAGSADHAAAVRRRDVAPVERGLHAARQSASSRAGAQAQWSDTVRDRSAAPVIGATSAVYRMTSVKTRPTAPQPDGPGLPANSCDRPARVYLRAPTRAVVLFGGFFWLVPAGSCRSCRCRSASTTAIVAFAHDHSGIGRRREEEVIGVDASEPSRSPGYSRSACAAREYGALRPASNGSRSGKQAQRGERGSWHWSFFSIFSHVSLEGGSGNFSVQNRPIASWRSLAKSSAQGRHYRDQLDWALERRKPRSMKRRRN